MITDERNDGVHDHNGPGCRGFVADENRQIEHEREDDSSDQPEGSIGISDATGRASSSRTSSVVLDMLNVYSQRERT